MAHSDIYSMEKSNIWKIIRMNDEEAPSMFIVTCVCVYVLVFFSFAVTKTSCTKNK